MSNLEEWNEFLGNLLSNAREAYTQTREYSCLQKQQAQMDMLLRDNLTADQKEMVEEYLFEIGVTADCETEQFYRQGFNDCIWLLKTLKIL